MDIFVFVFQVISFHLILSLTVECQCENGKGTEGKTGCIYSSIFEYSYSEPAVCLKRSTINGLTKKKACRNTNYCWYQCSANSGRGFQGTDLCQCDPKNETKPRDSMVPVECYIPAGTNCLWYRECLEKRIQCESTNERYAITYAEKYCKLYEERYASFSVKGKEWIDAVRKCLQETLAYVMYPQSNVTCQSVKEMAFLSHINCYGHPEQGIRFCDLSITDQLRVFWTIKGAMLEEFRKTISSGWSVFKSCDSYPQRTERIIRMDIEPSTINLNETNLEDIGKQLAILLEWSSDIMYNSSSSSNLSNPNSISVNILLSSRTYNDAYVSQTVNEVKHWFTKSTSHFALNLTDGKTLKIQGIKGCNDPNCFSTSFAFRASELRKDTCACVSNVNEAVNSRKRASISADIVGRLRKDSCYKITDGPVKSDNYIWYQLTHRCWNENLWVADLYLNESNDASSCENPVCSLRSKDLACNILNNTNIELRTNHPSGKVDSAYASENIMDTCNGRAACRSMYSCPECTYPGAPGGDVCLDESVLDFINELGKEKNIFVSSIAGACHSCSSRHYRGLAVDLSRRPNDFKYYMEKCRNMSGLPINEASHIHCQF